MSTRPRIALMLTGGTIDMIGKDRLDMASYMENGMRLSDQDLIARIPEVHEVADIVQVSLRKMQSRSIVDSDWLQWSRDIERLVQREAVDGVVMTHGTNTLEETALFLHLTLKSRTPVVLVGTMRPPSALSPDGDLNLINAVTVAASPQARGMGVLVVINDTIHSARDVTKAATYRVNAFKDRDLGPLGYVDNDRRVLFYHRPARPHTVDSEFAVGTMAALPRVDVFLSYPGADGTAINAFVAAGAQGLVAAATGSGEVTPTEDEALDRARDKGVVVCISSRVGSGRVARRPDLVRRGFVTSDNLLPWKARILLALALTNTRDPEDIQRAFDTY